MKSKVLSLAYLILCSLAATAQKAYSPRAFVKSCRSYMHTPYKLGGNDKHGIDCSGIVRNAFSVFDIDFPRVSHKQAEVFREIRPNRIRKGDLLYFRTSGSRINHTGVVLKKRGRRKLIFIHAASDGVRKDNLADAYWQKRFVKATRPLEYKKEK